MVDEDGVDDVEEAKEGVERKESAKSVAPTWRAGLCVLVARLGGRGDELDPFEALFGRLERSKEDLCMLAVDLVAVVVLGNRAWSNSSAVAQFEST